MNIASSAASVVIPVTDSTRVGEARRAARLLGMRLGLDETAQGKLSVVVTEAAQNLARHARDGVIVLRSINDGLVGLGLEVLSLDRGPGIADLRACMKDGFSTAGSPGTGFGAMTRIADQFDVHSIPGRGTALVLRVGQWRRADAGSHVELGAVCVAKHGETHCGDAWAVQPVAGGFRVLVVDGLGHGPEAAKAATEAVRIFHEAGQFDLGRVIMTQHAALRSTRGAALAIAELDLERRLVRYAGIGNISAIVLAPPASQCLVSHNGIVGHEMRKVHEFVYAWPPQALLVMHSDGLQTRWQLDDYPGLITRHPALAAGTLFRDHARPRDDVTVVAVADFAA